MIVLASCFTMRLSPQVASPTIFRNLERGAVFPSFEVADLSGEKVTVVASSDLPSVIAFLRPDQDDSRNVLRSLEKLALDPKGPRARLLLIGLRGHAPDQWVTLRKGLPRRITLFLDKYRATESVGMVMSPSVAVLDPSGRLRNSHVLYDPKLIEHLRRNLRELAQEEGLVPDRAEKGHRLYEELANNAAALESAGMPREALPLRRQLLRLGLHPAEDNASLGQLYYRLGEMNEAIACFRRSLELNAKLPVRAWLGRALAKKGQLSEAEAHLTVALKLDSKKAVIHRTLAHIAKKRDDVDGALQCIKAAIGPSQAGAQAEPSSDLVGTLARELSLRGLSGETIRFSSRDPIQNRLTVLVFWATWSRFCEHECTQLAKLWPQWSKRGVKIVAISVEASRIRDEQLQTIRKWLADRPLPFPVAVDDGLLAFRTYGVVAVPTTIVVDSKGNIVMRLAGFTDGGAERLVKLVEHRLVEEGKASERPPLEAVSLGHRQAIRYLRLARVLVEKEENEMAEYTLKRAIEQDAELIEARVELAQLYEAMKKPAVADAILTKAASRFPNDSSLLLARAKVMFRRASHARAEALAQRALGQNPSLAPALTLLGRIHLARNNQDKALAAFEAAAGRNPLDPRPLIQAARILELQGHKDRALEHYERAYELLQVK